MTAAPSLPSQIAELNAASELIAANYGALDLNGWGPEANRAQITLGRQRALLEYIIRCGVLTGEELRKVVAKYQSEGAR